MSPYGLVFGFFVLQIFVHSPVLHELDVMISHNPANIKESAKMVVTLRTIWII